MRMPNRTATFAAAYCLASLFTTPAHAGPFHDCATDPPALANGVHTNHGTDKCGNVILGTSTGTESSCVTGCTLPACALGEWSNTLNCFSTGGFNICGQEGSIRCGSYPNTYTRSYSFACASGTNGSWPLAAGTRTGAACTPIDEDGHFGPTITCDCSVSESYWSANCG